MNIQKCAIIGCGDVGATCAYALAINGLFSEIVLIDINMRKAEGEALDIGHGMPHLKPVNVYAGTYEDLKDAFLIMIAAGVPQTIGETRMDILEENVKIFKSIIPQVVRNNKEAILLVLTNPVDILTSVTLELSGFPKNRVLGSGTVLDTGRCQYYLGKCLDVDPKNVYVHVVGEHGDSELIVWSNAKVAGLPIEEYAKQMGVVLDKEKIFEDVRDSAYKIIENKGSTYYAIAVAVVKIAEAIIRDEKSILTLSHYLEDSYGISGVCMGVPAVVGAKGIEREFEICMSEQECKLLHESAKELKGRRKDIHDLI